MQFHSDSDQPCSPCQQQAAMRVGHGARKRPRSPRTSRPRSPHKKSEWVRTLMAHTEGQHFTYKGKKYRKGRGITAKPMQRSSAKKKKKKKKTATAR